MELEKKWQRTFADRATRFETPHEISHWTPKGFETRRNRIAREIKKLHRPGERVLDLGSGPGHYGGLFEHPVLVDYAREVFSRTPSALSLHRVCADFGALPFRSGSFDGLLCVGVLQCRRLTQEDLAGAARVLKPGGWFLFETLNCESTFLHYDLRGAQFERLARFIGRKEEGPCYFLLDEYVIYQAGKLIPWFERAGLKVRGLQYLCFPDPVSLVQELVAHRACPAPVPKNFAKSFYLFGVKSRV